MAYVKSCKECPYCCQDEDDDYPCCKYGESDGYAPCEYEEPEEINWEDYM